MKVTVSIYRDPETGNLFAWVVQDGKRGRNLLMGRAVKDVHFARSLVRAELNARVPDVEITWGGEGE
jgi:hypothetical protein